MNCEHCRYTLCECGKAIWSCNKVEDWWKPHRLHLVPGWNHFISAGHHAIPKKWVGANNSLSLGEIILGLRVYG